MTVAADIPTRIDALKAADLKAAGVEYVMRYIDNTWGRSGTSLTETEVKVCEYEGLMLLVVYRRIDGDGEFKTRDQGLEDAGFALAAARVTGYPLGRPIFFPGRSPGYFKGVADVLGEYHPVGGILDGEIRGDG